MPGKRWSQQEKDSLRQQLHDLEHAVEEVKIAGRPAHGIRRQAVRMGLIEPHTSRARWEDGQVDKLKELKQQGFEVSQIFAYQLLGEPRRSLWSIRKMWGRLHLADQQRSESMRCKKVWAPGERRQFDQFLRKNSRQMTPEEIGKVFGVARSTVARRQTELGVKVPRAQVLQMAYSRTKQQAARRRAQQRNIELWQQRRQEREANLIELAKRLRKKQPANQRTCTDCKRRWPKRAEFFHIREKTISIGTSRYYKHRCILCENRRRREQERKRKDSAVD